MCEESVTATEAPVPPRPAAPGSRGRRDRRVRDRMGPLLPDRSDADDPVTWGDSDSESEAWLRRQVPPHHGG